MVISKSIADLDPPFIWLGGGEVHLKLYVNVKELIEKVDPYIFDCTAPRENMDEDLY